MHSVFATALVTLVVAAGCGGGSDDTASDADGSGASQSGAATDGGCATLATEEVEQIIGAEIADVSELPVGCQWSLADPGPTGAAAYDYQSIEESMFESNRESAEAAGFTVEAEDGIGEDAYWRLQVNTEGQKTNGELWVRLGDSSFYVRAQGIEYGEDIRDHQREIADRLVSELR